MATYLERYLQGECETVWKELIALGEQVRQEPVYADAQAVAYEIMRRVRVNVELLVVRLQSIGYVFGGYPGYRGPLSEINRFLVQPSYSVSEDYIGPLLPPIPGAGDRIAQFEAECAPIPIIMKACCEIVGNVDFRGIGPSGWNGFHDELVIDSKGIFDSFEEWGDYEDADGNLDLPIDLFPCFLNKRNVSGIGWVGFYVPNGAADVPLYIDDDPYPNGASFVDYLRVSILQCAGFPGILREGDYEEGKAFITRQEELIKDLILF